MYIYVCVYMYIFKHMYTYLYSYIHICTYIFIYMYGYINLYIYIYTYTYFDIIDKHKYILHTHTHTRTHIHKHIPQIKCQVAALMKSLRTNVSRNAAIWMGKRTRNALLEFSKVSMLPNLLYTQTIKLTFDKKTVDGERSQTSCY